MQCTISATVQDSAFDTFFTSTTIDSLKNNGTKPKNICVYIYIYRYIYNQCRLEVNLNLIERTQH